MAENVVALLNEAKPLQDAHLEVAVPVAEANTAVPLPAADWIPLNEPEPAHGERRSGAKVVFLSYLSCSPDNLNGHNGLISIAGTFVLVSQ
jgi:hypothetical protein